MKRSDMRHLAAAVILATLLSACAGIPALPTNTPVQPTFTPPPPTRDFPSAPAVPIRLSGTGQQASQPIRMAVGLTRFSATFQGSGNFVAELLDQNGEVVELLANVIDSSSTSTAFKVPATAEYVVNVMVGDGNWQIEVGRMGSAELAQAIALPQTFTGTGSQHSAPFKARRGALRVVAKHNGKSNFVVTVLDAQGETVALVANGIGNVASSQVTGLPTQGPYVLVVMADGEWTIEVTQ